MCFNTATQQQLIKKIRDLPPKDFAEAVIGVLGILHMLSVADDYILLSSPGATQNIISEDSSRMICN